MRHRSGGGDRLPRYTGPAGTVFVLEINGQTTLKQRKRKDNERTDDREILRKESERKSSRRAVEEQ